MEKILSLLSLFCFSIVASPKHDAYFTIESAEHTVNVLARFPQALHNEMLTRTLDIENSDESSKLFFDYVQTNFILYDNKNKPLSLQSVKHLERADEAGMVYYVFIYKNRSVSKVTNSLLFSVNDDQVNYHVLLDGKKSTGYITKIDSPSFEVTLKKTKHYYYWFFIPLIVILLFAVFLRGCKHHRRTDFSALVNPV